MNCCIDEKQTRIRFESLVFNLLSGVGLLDELKKKQASRPFLNVIVSFLDVTKPTTICSLLLKLFFHLLIFHWKIRQSVNAKPSFWSLGWNDTTRDNLRQRGIFTVLLHNRKVGCVIIQIQTLIQTLSNLPIRSSQIYGSPSSYQPQPFWEDLDRLPYLLTSSFEHFPSFLWKCTAQKWAWQDHLTKACWGDQ